MPEEQSDRLTFPVEGMHCASCVSSVDGALEGVEGVAEANVNLATEKASVSFENGSVAPETLVDAVDRAGYEVPTEKMTLPVEGMHCASCVSTVDEFLSDVPGVLEANVNLATEKATVTYILGTANSQSGRASCRERV